MCPSRSSTTYVRSLVVLAEMSSRCGFPDRKIILRRNTSPKGSEKNGRYATLYHYENCNNLYLTINKLVPFSEVILKSEYLQLKRYNNKLKSLRYQIILVLS